MRWTEETILDAVEQHFQRITPCRMIRQVEHAGRRIDGLVIFEGGHRVAIEAKTNRADFRRETAAKRHASWLLAQQCFYAAPSPSIIQFAEVPEGWGLLHVCIGGAAQAVAAEHHHVRPLSSAQINALLLRLAATEDRLRSPQTPEERAGALAVEVERLEGLLADAREAATREMARAQDAVEQVMIARGDDALCEACGEPIVYTRVHGWGHETPSLDRECEGLRAERERRRREVLTGAAYLTPPPPRIAPAGRPTDH